MSSGCCQQPPLLQATVAPASRCSCCATGSTCAAAAAYIANGPATSHGRHGFGLDCVRLAASGEAIGLSGLLQRATLEVPDIGYAFLQAHHGQGYATEAARSVLQHAHQVLRMTKLYALTAPHNQASMRVLQKVGFSLQQPDYRSEHGERSCLFVQHFAP